MLRKGITILRTSNNDFRKDETIVEFPHIFATKVKEFTIDTSNSDRSFIATEIISKINAMKPLRDSYLDFLKEMLFSSQDVKLFIYSFFETTYNTLMLVDKGINSWLDSSFEHYKIFIWELFVCTIVYLRYYEKYSLIHDILTHTYYLQWEISQVQSIKQYSFVKFRCYSNVLDDTYRHKENLILKTADMIVTRVKEPIITKESFAETDIFLTQMSFALKISDYGRYRFALSYIYTNNPENIWVRLSSKEYCEKILPLFGVRSIDELKKIIVANPVPSDYCYPNAWNSIPPIPLQIGNYEIASLK